MQSTHRLPTSCYATASHRTHQEKPDSLNLKSHHHPLTEPTHCCACVQMQSLQQLPGLPEALNIMESFVMHNVYIDQMLLYRGMEPLSEMLGDWKLRDRMQTETPRSPDCQGAPCFAPPHTCSQLCVTQMCAYGFVLPMFPKNVAGFFLRMPEAG
jgi:hypothetical protein